MLTNPSALFSVVGVVYGLLLPLAILVILCLVLVPSLLAGGAKVENVARAAYCYLLEALGILLMTLGGIPAIYGVLARQPYESNTYLALLIVFASGGLSFLWHDHIVRGVDSAARAVPHAIFLTVFKLLGYLITLLSALSLLLTMLLGTALPGAQWWVMPTILLAYGFILSWCTRPEESAGPFQSSAFTRPAFPKMMPKGKLVPAGGKKR